MIGIAFVVIIIVSIIGYYIMVASIVSNLGNTMAEMGTSLNSINNPVTTFPNTYYLKPGQDVISTTGTTIGIKGMTDTEASAYCVKNNGRLATQAEVFNAHNKGYSSCSPGFMESNDNDGMRVGYNNMLGKDTSCDHSSSASSYDLNSRYGAFCRGNPPADIAKNNLF
jgi:hypothetical protein